MVLVLAGGVGPGSGSARDFAAGTMGVTLFSPMPDDAQIGSGRTVSQVSARRAGAAPAPAAVADAGGPAPVLGAVTLLLLAVRLHSVPRLSRPLLRGPPPA